MRRYSEFLGCQSPHTCPQYLSTLTQQASAGVFSMLVWFSISIHVLLLWLNPTLFSKNLLANLNLLNEHWTGVVGTLVWQRINGALLWWHNPKIYSTSTGLVWLARWRGQCIDSSLLRWHNLIIYSTSTGLAW